MADEGRCHALLKPARLGAGAEPLPRGSLLAAAPAAAATVAAVAAGGATFILLFDGTTPFLFKFRVAIMRQARGGIRRRRKGVRG